VTREAGQEAANEVTLRAELADMLAQPSVAPHERFANELLLARVMRSLREGSNETRVDRYIIRGELGRGSFGVVYRAYDPQLHLDVALKLLSTGASEAIKRFEREAQALANVRGQHVVHVLNIGEYEGQRWIAMDYVEGVTLREWLQEQHKQSVLDWRAIVERFIECARGLVELHRAGFVHRDFKPGNVMLDRRNDNRAKVLDFGLVATAMRETPAQGRTPPSLQWYTQLTREGVVLGTYSYLSPEQFMSASVDARSDQFSFFVALYEALYREIPRVGELPLGPALAIHDGKVPPLTSPPIELPGWIWRALERGLSYDPERRFPDLAAAIEALKAPEDRPSEAALLLRGFVLGAVSVAVIAALLVVFL
jgi:serine/threonine protein kinase